MLEDSYTTDRLMQWFYGEGGCDLALSDATHYVKAINYGIMFVIALWMDPKDLEGVDNTDIVLEVHTFEKRTVRSPVLDHPQETLRTTHERQ